MSDRHWTLDATHLGTLTDAEAAVIERDIVAVFEKYNVLHGKYNEYSVLLAFQLEYEKARICAAKGRA